MALWLHWHVNEPPPPELIKFVLYDRFKWTPEQVKAIPLPELLTILVIMGEEAKYRSRPKSKEITKTA